MLNWTDESLKHFILYQLDLQQKTRIWDTISNKILFLISAAKNAVIEN